MEADLVRYNYQFVSQNLQIRVSLFAEEHSCLVRIIAPGIALADLILRVSCVILVPFEEIAMGFVNIGCCCKKGYFFRRGCELLTAGVFNFIKIPIDLVHCVFDTTHILLVVLFRPTKTFAFEVPAYAQEDITNLVDNEDSNFRNIFNIQIIHPYSSPAYKAYLKEFPQVDPQEGDF